MTPVTLETRRLLLRPWKDADTEPFIALNGDVRVCEFYPTERFERTESLAMVSRIREEMHMYGFGLWALEVKQTGVFIGFTGLKHLRSYHPLAQNVEIGWRLAPEYWRQGYASEAATEALRYGLNELALPEIVAFTSHLNKRSQKVMERIGMTREKSRDFEHPEVPTGHALRAHVVYSKKRNDEKQ